LYDESYRFFLEFLGKRTPDHGLALQTTRYLLFEPSKGIEPLQTRLSFGYFSLARQRKVTPAPGRGDANRPLTSQAIHDKPRTTDKRRRPRQKRAKEPRPINPVAIAQDASRAVA
ncbi:hypothetical protein PI859_09665, partial [Burkholderia pseudomallei]